MGRGGDKGEFELERGYPPVELVRSPYAVEMFSCCPVCESGDFDFIDGDLGACDECGERFYPDVSGEPYQGPPLVRLYHVSDTAAETLAAEGLDATRNTHGWVYLAEHPWLWLDYFGAACSIHEVDVRGIALCHDPAGYARDFYCEGTIPPERLRLLTAQEKQVLLSPTA